MPINLIVLELIGQLPSYTVGVRSLFTPPAATQMLIMVRFQAATAQSGFVKIELANEFLCLWLHFFSFVSDFGAVSVPLNVQMLHSFLEATYLFSAETGSPTLRTIVYSKADGWMVVTMDGSTVWNIQTTVKWIAKTFFTDIYGHQIKM